MAAARAVTRAELDAARERIAPLFSVPIPDDEASERSIRLYMAIKKIVEKEGWDFYTIQSFPGLGDDYSATCFAQSMMMEDGVGTSTLSDFNTAMSVKLLMDLSGEPVYYGDLQHIDKATARDQDHRRRRVPAVARPEASNRCSSPSTASRPKARRAGSPCNSRASRGEGVLARLGRNNGEFEMVITRCDVVEPRAEELAARQAGVRHPLLAARVCHTPSVTLRRLLEAWNNEYAVLGYGEHLYDDLLAFCEQTGIRAIAI